MKITSKLIFDNITWFIGVSVSVLLLYPQWQRALVELTKEPLSYFLIKYLLPSFYFISVLFILIGINLSKPKEEEHYAKK
jgi:hypothetical protein